MVVPLHGGAAYVGRSHGRGDDLNFVPADERTLQAKAAPDIFVIGDAANVPASKAGSVSHFEGETVVGNIQRHLRGEPLVEGFDGTPTASSRPGSTRVCSSTSTTSRSRCPDGTPGRWACRC